MTAGEGLTIMHHAITTVAKISAPILLLSMAVGVIISIFQAATQIHEQTITFVPKLLVILLILFMAGGWMLQTIMDFADQIFFMMRNM